jgi:hypothetical protein
LSVPPRSGQEQPENVVDGDSPYATGGGGVSFERRVAVTYLARLLTGAIGPEMHGRRIDRVSFQQAPAHQVDDLVISATRDDGTDPLVLDIAVRRAPKFTTSDTKTQALVGDLLVGLRSAAAKDAERRFGICVAGPRQAALEVGELAALARQQTTAVDFFSLIQTDGRFKKPIRERLSHLIGLVSTNLSVNGEQRSQESTWGLLKSLEIRMPRLEPPDETDWCELLNQLEPWAREQSVAGAIGLRDRLESLAASYAPAAAQVDLAKLRRDAHELLHIEQRRRMLAWNELRRFDSDARGAVRYALGVGPAQNPLHLPRLGQAALLRKELQSGGAVLVSGESGVGRSALVLGELAKAAASDPESYEVVCLNLRLLPPTSTEIRKALGGVSLEELLSEMSAPTRILVLDAAEIELERDIQLLPQLLRAAQISDVSPWVLSATEGRAALLSVMEQTIGAIRELTIDGLDDENLGIVAKAFPHLRRLVEEPRAKDLLRRPVIADYLVRSGSQELPLTDSDAFEIIWTKLVRNDGRRNRGFPDARDQVMRQLALQELRPIDAVTLEGSLNTEALVGLQQDALLRPAAQWQLLPVFAHDLLRTYAIARVLLSFEDPIGELIAIGAPRLALPALRLVIQVRLGAPNSLSTPFAGRYVDLQAAVERLAAAGHGVRWSDLPSEAVLSLPDAQAILGNAWPTLLEGDAAGLQRVLRVILQRNGRTRIVDRVVAEPLVAQLIECGWPSQLKSAVNELLLGWLRGLVQTGEPSGHRLRINLRELLVAIVSEGDIRLTERRREEKARLAARSPEAVARDRASARTLRPINPISIAGRRRQRRLSKLPPELLDDKLLQQLAMLSYDLGDAGEALLRRLAAEAPEHLLSVLEGLWAGSSLAARDIGLIVHLIEAYYIDDDEEENWGIGNYGIRRHKHLALTPLSAPYRGPFLAMFRADLPTGVGCLNRLLNHAAQVRVRDLRRLDCDEATQAKDRYVAILDISGDRREYFGDEHVWNWYRGTGVGPYPCMSALQALEIACDEFINGGVRMAELIRILLCGCENLAIPGFAVGLLTRHLERVEAELDPFLAEPVIWKLDFMRVIRERSYLAALPEGIIAPERRTWTLRDGAMWLTLNAVGDRVEVLKGVGRQLFSRAAEREGGGDGGELLSEWLAIVLGWASSLNRDTYKLVRSCPKTSIFLDLAQSSELD